MELISINVGSEVRLGDIVTGICKEPHTGEIKLTNLGLQNDVVSDKKYHGGPDQAVYVYGGDDYDYWRKDHDLDLVPGTFGDNLTISGLSSLSINVGDQFQIGDVRLEATAPRIPCATLGRRMQNPSFPVTFRKSQRCGFYCRVLHEGSLMSPLAVQHKPSLGDDPLSIVDMFELYYDPSPTRGKLEHALNAPIASRDRGRFVAKLEKLDV